MIKNRYSRFTPLIITISVIVGIGVGSFLTDFFQSGRLSIIKNSSNKLSDLLHVINDRYVDTVNIADLVEGALPKLLEELDPHSTYVSAKNVELEMQDLKGSFSGIGIIFNTIDDTARVVHVIKGGPSESVGIKAGDRIIKVDNDTFTGSILTNEYAMKRLKGPRDSKVTVSIKRKHSPSLIDYDIIRGDIPVKSIDCAYMYDESTGYIRIGSFGDTTYPELLAALAKLHHEGLTSLVIDLRGNKGGYMAPSVQMANEFLSKNKLIVYTKGRKVKRMDYKSDGRGSYQHIPLVVLIDETTASASEIFAAAIQDNDRGTIIGRRSFGKGLVQEPLQFSDKSMLRLTIARYYSPSERCLQKPYEKGGNEKYNQELLQRAKGGEYYHEDSIHVSGKKYKTSIGRTVYGGGGVTPDIFIPADTIGITSYFQDALYDGHLVRFAYKYVDDNRERFVRFSDYQSLLEFLQGEKLPEKFSDYALAKGLKKRYLMMQKSYKLFQEYLCAFIIDDYFGQEEKIMFSNQSDPCMLRAIKVIKEGKAFPCVKDSISSPALIRTLRHS